MSALGVDARTAATGGRRGLDYLLGEQLDDELLLHRSGDLAGHSGLARGPLVVVGELLLEHAVVAAGLLLLTQLHAVFGLARAPAAVVAGRVVAPLDPAL